MAVYCLSGPPVRIGTNSRILISCIRIPKYLRITYYRQPSKSHHYRVSLVLYFHNICDLGGAGDSACSYSSPAPLTAACIHRRCRAARARARSSSCAPAIATAINSCRGSNDKRIACHLLHGLLRIQKTHRLSVGCRAIHSASSTQGRLCLSNHLSSSLTIPVHATLPSRKNSTPRK
jgi:hypothetical protein